MSKRRQFPSAHMPGQEKRTIATSPPSIKIFKAVQNHHAIDIFPRVLRELRKLAGHPSDLPDHSANHALLLFLAPIRKRQMHIEHRGPPQRRTAGVGDVRKYRANKSRRWPR